MLASWNSQLSAVSALDFIEGNKLVKQFVSIYKEEIDAFREQAAEDADSSDEDKALSREEFVDKYLPEILDFIDYDADVIEVMSDTIKRFDECTLVRYDEYREEYIIDFLSMTPQSKEEVFSLYATIMKRAMELDIPEIDLKKHVMQGLLGA